MTLQTLQQRSFETMRQASREYIRQRVTMRTAEVRRETDAEIREAIGGVHGDVLPMLECEP